MSERLFLDSAALHRYAQSGHSDEMLKLLAEYLAREQDHATQHELFRELLQKYVALTRELHTYIARIETQNQQLEVLNAQKNELLGIAAHDLRNPLAGIQVYAELLLRMLNENLTEKQQDFLERIHQSSLFMAHLIDDLLDLSKIESGTLILENACCDYGDLVRQNVQTNAVLAEKKQMTIALQSEPSLPTLSIDSQKIEQVLNNLLSNAIKFSHPGTTISVNVRRCDNLVMTEVIDHGQGIPADELPHIFKTFHKASVQATGGEKSTGLGLAIVKKIVEGHGGTLNVTSQVGQGSAFSFGLPVTEPVPSEENPPRTILSLTD